MRVKDNKFLKLQSILGLVITSGLLAVVLIKTTGGLGTQENQNVVENKSIFVSESAHDKQIAFPGAEGFGRYAQGGRGGDVYYVTNLDDDGPGSLRYGIENRDGPRTIMFEVSGTIYLDSALFIRDPYLTIAGQTAPGDGITLANWGLYVSADHVIVRYIRSRHGDNVYGSKRFSVAVNNAHHVIFDHVTMSWGTNTNYSSNPRHLDYDNDYITIQWSIISEPLYNAAGVDEGRAFGDNIRAPHESRLNNLYAHNRHRNAMVGNWGLVEAEFQNNVIYNWALLTGYGPVHGNWVNNYYKPGPAGDEGEYPAYQDMIFRIGYPSDWHENEKGENVDLDYEPKIYVDGNHMEGSPEITTDNWDGGVQFRNVEEEDVRLDSPFDYPSIGNTLSAEEAYELVLEKAGASLSRDSIDERIVEEVRTGTATYGGDYGAGTGIIDSGHDVGGYPELESTEPPVDSDGDGLPDWWKEEHDLEVGDSEEGNRDRNGDGYTNLEEYLAWLADPQGKFLDRHHAYDETDVLAQPELKNPENGEDKYPTSLYLHWESVENAEDYELQISKDENFQSTVSFKGNQDNAILSKMGSEEMIVSESDYDWLISLKVDDLDYESQYYWRTRAINGDKSGPWSEEWSFETRMNGEVSPELVSPEDGSEDIEIPVEVEWESLEGASLYELEVSASPAFDDNSLVIKDIEETEAVVEEMVTDTTTYFWRVRAEVDNQWTEWSSSWSFTTELRSPEVPPAWRVESVEEVEEGDVYIEWEPFERADWYNVQLSADKDFEELIVDTDNTEDEGLYVSGLNGGSEYYWRLKAFNDAGSSDWTEKQSIQTAISVGVDDGQEKPDEFALNSNYPNPFNPQTQIRYELPEQAQVRLTVYNMLGEQVTTLVNESQSAGHHEVTFDASDLSSGTYIYRLEAGDYSESRTMMFVK